MRFVVMLFFQLFFVVFGSALYERARFVDAVSHFIFARLNRNNQDRPGYFCEKQFGLGRRMVGRRGQYTSRVVSFQLADST